MINLQQIAKRTRFDPPEGINICRANEATTKQMKSFANITTDEPTAIHRIHNDRQLCERCGTGHNKQRPSPAIGATCRKCGCKNHFAKMCRTKIKPLYGLKADEDSHISTDMFISTIQKSQNTRE